MNIDTILDAIVSNLDAKFSEFELVQIADTIPQASFSLPACLVSYGNVDEAAYSEASERHLSVDFRVLIVYKETARATLDEKLSAYIDHINGNDWSIAVNEAIFTGASLAEFDPPKQDLYARVINFTQDFKV
jgi:hypothetical protein